MSKPRVMTLKGFLDCFLSQHQQRPEHPFFFALGAGASKQSGIPTGQELSRQWLNEMWTADDFDDSTLEQWATAEQLDIRNFDLENCCDFYPEIYEKRFGEHPEAGFAFLESIMDGKEPSYGYAVLAYLMSETTHRIVVTTNFDNLVGDALYIHSTKFPLIIGHDSLVGYASVDPRRPLVAKLHGAIGFSPKNLQDEVRHLPDSWQKPLEGIFRRCTPIVIGYNGNDGGLMGFLEKLPPSVPDNIYWCVRTNESKPERIWSTSPERVRSLVSGKKGHIVPIPGFDELMLLLSDHLREQLTIPDLYIRLQERARKREEFFDNQIKSLREVLGKKTPVTITEASRATAVSFAEVDSNNEVDNLLQDAASRLSELRPEKPWWEWIIEIRDEPDPDKKDTLYKAAMDALPMDADILGNYAVFLTYVQKDHDRAEEFYRRAIDLNPTNVNILFRYAAFLKRIRKDYDRAEEFYSRAFDTDPEDVDGIGAYASFLTDIRKDYDRAERLYLRAIDIEPTDADILGNYAVFLTHTRKDYSRAEEFYRRAVDADPESANNLGNYAQLLFILGKNKEGIEYLSQAETSEKDRSPALEIELSFYRAAHDQESWPQVLKKIKEVIRKDNRSPKWALDANIERAKADGHPNPELLQVLANVITEDEDVTTLDAFLEWKSTG